MVGLVTCSVCDGTDDNDGDGLGAITDGAGYVALSGGRRRGLGALPSGARPPAAKAEAVPRRALAAEGTCCDGAAATSSGRWYGDTNGDCVFDIKDVRRASVRLAG